MRIRYIMIAVLIVSLFLAGWLLLRQSIGPSTTLRGGIGTKLEELIELDPLTGMPLKP